MNFLRQWWPEAVYCNIRCSPTGTSALCWSGLPSPQLLAHPSAYRCPLCSSGCSSPYSVFLSSCRSVLLSPSGMVVFASAMYYAERGEYDAVTGLWMRTNASGEVAPSPFQSIPAAMWWAIVTMTTVGYGDMFPVTGLGKLIASVAALSGLMVIAIPVTVISTNFNAQVSSSSACGEIVYCFLCRKLRLRLRLPEASPLQRLTVSSSASSCQHRLSHVRVPVSLPACSMR